MIQSVAQRYLGVHGLEPDIDTIYLVANVGDPTERVLEDGAAGRVIWPSLFWFAWPMRWVPLPLLNFGYQLFARVRYRLFGRADSCVVPTPEERARFVE